MPNKKPEKIRKKIIEVIKKPPVLFIALPFFLVVVWFGDGMMMATGEEGLVFYNAKRMLNLYGDFWINVGTGYLTPLYEPRLPFYYIVSLLQQIGFEGWIVQALIFFAMIILGMYGAYIFYKELVDEKFIYFNPLTASLFYAFNLFVVRQVWVRFLVTGIMAWAYLPMFLYLLLKFILEGRTVILIIFLATNILFSYIYSSPAFVLTYWIPALAIMIYAVFIKNKNGKITPVIIRCFAIVFLWLVVSSWWLYPSLTLAKSSYDVFMAGKANVDSLSGVSEFFPLSEVLFLKQKFLFSGADVWRYYHNTSYVIISWLILGLAVLGLYLGRKIKIYWWGISLLIISLFIIKGTNFPLGVQFYEFIFKTVPLSGVLRNPYEKFGITYVLIYGFFFTIGFEWIIAKFFKKNKDFFHFLFSVIFFGIFLWPFWEGVIFKKIKVSVPQYYNKMNQKIVSANDTSVRILHVPLNPGDGVEYSWNVGYSGVDQMHLLFDNPSVARMIHSSKYLDKKHTEMYNALVNNQNIAQLMDEMNIMYLVYHKDFSSGQDWVIKGTPKNKISNDPLFEFEEKIGEVELYKYTNFKERNLFVIDGNESNLYNYEKITSRHFTVSVKDISKPYTLLFKSTYHPLWKAEIDKHIPLPHIIAYGYANAWNINKKGSYNIDIKMPVWPWEK